MERDFLGLRKDSGQLVNEDFRARGQDGALLGSAMQWPFSNKTTAMQQYMSYKAAQEEWQKKFAIEQFPTSGFQPLLAMDAFGASQKTSVALSSQKFDGQLIHQYPLQAYQPQGTGTLINSPHKLSENRPFPVLAHHSLPVATAAPFFQVHGAQTNPNIMTNSLNHPSYGRNLSTSAAASANAAFPPRSMPKPAPTTAQLTIFYAGTVNVFDDVSVEKAQAILLLASKGPNADSDVAKEKPEVPLRASVPAPAIQTPVSNQSLQTTIPVPMFQTAVQAPILQAVAPVKTKLPQTNGLSSKISVPAPVRVPSPCSAVSSPISVTSRLGVNSGSVSSTTDDLAGPKMAGPLTSASPQETLRSSAAVSCSFSPADAMPRAIPQARKATLARFLEKRKERVKSVMPYYNKKNTESGTQFDRPNALKLSSSTDVNVSSKIVDSWCLGQSKASVISEESPSTKLKM